MVEFKCTLTPDAVARLHGALSCLAKFNENLGIEITDSKLTLISINAMKTTCASMSLSSDVFFQSYNFTTDDHNAYFRCSLYNKSLASVFKGRSGDGKDPDSALERCEFALQDEPDRVDCKLIVTMVARSGVRKIYRLNYDPTEILRAVFNRDAVANRWTMSAYMLKSFSEYFGQRTELLDFYSDEGRVTITSYTEKVMKGSEVLKQPLQTQIEVDSLDFVDYQVEDGMHVGINVKDFRAIVTHAETLKTEITALFGHPGRPLSMEYEDLGLLCEYTLSTTGQYRGTKTPTPATSRQPSVLPQRQPSTATIPAQAVTSARASAAPLAVQERATSARGQDSRQPSAMPPPSRPASRTVPTGLGSQQNGSQFTSTARSSRPPALAPSASVDEQSLFINDDNDDQQWDEANYEQDEQDQLGWGETYSEPLKTLTQGSLARSKSMIKESFATEEMESLPVGDEDVPPTQPIGGMKGLFD